MQIVDECIVLHEQIEVNDALAGLGLALAELRQAVEVGEGARMSRTKLDAPGAGGYYSYTATTRSLREIKIPQGWKPKNYKNLPTIVHPDENLAVAVSTGNDATGRLGSVPKTKYPKGGATQEILEVNRQLWLAGFEEPDFEEGDANLPRHTWLLLRFRHEGFVYWELSLPLEVDGEGRVHRWAKRILLSPLDFTGPGNQVEYDDEAEEDVVVPVERRS